MRILKDKIFERTRAFNIVQMVDFLVMRFSKYYEGKLLEASYNRLSSLSKVKKFPARLNEEITKVSENVYRVESSTGSKTYEVDTLACCCTCTVGINGKPCKHQFWVVESDYEVEMCTMNTPACRELWYVIAKGKKPSPELLAGLHESHSPRVITEVTAQMQQPPSSPVEDNIEFDNSVSNDDTRVVKELLDSFLSRITSIVSDAALREPRLFIQPITKCLETLSNLKTTNGIVSALQTFGRYEGGGSV